MMREEVLAATGRTVRTQELVSYPEAGGWVVGCWGDQFPEVREALRAPGAA